MNEWWCFLFAIYIQSYWNDDLFNLFLLYFQRNLSGNETAEHQDVYNSNSPSSHRPRNFKFILKYFCQCTKYLGKISINDNWHFRSLIEDIDRTQLEFLTAEVMILLLFSVWYLSTYLMFNNTFDFCVVHQDDRFCEGSLDGHPNRVPGHRGWDHRVCLSALKGDLFFICIGGYDLQW